MCLGDRGSELGDAWVERGKIEVEKRGEIVGVSRLKTGSWDAAVSVFCFYFSVFNARSERGAGAGPIFSYRFFRRGRGRGKEVEPSRRSILL